MATISSMMIELAMKTEDEPTEDDAPTPVPPDDGEGHDRSNRPDIGPGLAALIALPVAALIALWFMAIPYMSATAPERTGCAAGGCAPLAVLLAAGGCGAWWVL